MTAQGERRSIEFKWRLAIEVAIQNLFSSYVNIDVPSFCFKISFVVLGWCSSIWFIHSFLSLSFVLCLFLEIKLHIVLCFLLSSSISTNVFLSCYSFLRLQSFQPTTVITASRGKEQFVFAGLKSGQVFWFWVTRVYGVLGFFRMNSIDCFLWPLGHLSIVLDCNAFLLNEIPFIFEKKKIEKEIIL